MGPPSSQESHRPSSPLSVRPTPSGSLLVQLLLLLALCPLLQGGLCPASQGQAVDLLTRAALSARPWLDPTGGAPFPAVAPRLPAQASPASLGCPASPPSVWRHLSLPSSTETEIQYPVLIQYDPVLRAAKTTQQEPTTSYQ